MPRCVLVAALTYRLLGKKDCRVIPVHKAEEPHSLISLSSMSLSLAHFQGVASSHGPWVSEGQTRRSGTGHTCQSDRLSQEDPDMTLGTVPHDLEPTFY